MTAQSTYLEKPPTDCLLRAVDATGAVRWYITTNDGLAALDPAWTFGSLMSLPEDEFHAVVDGANTMASAGLTVLAPVDGDSEVWACGVTYETSRSARTSESTEADIYDRVYKAERPELFFKAVGWRISGPDGPAGVRHDSTWDVPEPELALVCNAQATVVGYTICNDMSSRSIEGENPLYLPQAKMYRHACALGPWIRLARSLPDPRSVGISIEIVRDGECLWSGSDSTLRLKRSLSELVSCLFRAEVFPSGVVLSTGTSVVPDDSVSVIEGDVIGISIEDIGCLRTTAVRV